jgi:hypothetical protein
VKEGSRVEEFSKAFSAPLPETVLRHFTNLSHAESFIQGNIRIGYYKSYAYLPKDNIRRNPNESTFTGTIVRPSGKTSFGIIGGSWAIYILCFFHPKTSKQIRQPHGEFVVRIKNIKEFHSRICKHLGPIIKGNLIGHMVYRGILKVESEDFDANLALHAYSDGVNHKDKREIRLSYVFNPDKLDVPTPSPSERTSLALPSYYNITNAPISDLCELCDH